MGEANKEGGNGSLSAGAALLMLVRRWGSWQRAATWLWMSGASGEPGEGFWRASVILWTPARIRLLDEASGVVALVKIQEQQVQNI
jgi:hypothetical protein